MPQVPGNGLADIIVRYWWNDPEREICTTYKTTVNLASQFNAYAIIVDEIISNFINNKNSFDYASNVHPQRTFPHGSDIEIFTFEALQTAWKEAKKSSEREHVTPYIYNNQKFKLFNHTSKNDLSNFRWTVDYLEDLELVRQIISRIQARPILIKDIITLMSENPKLKKINQIHSKK